MEMIGEKTVLIRKNDYEQIKMLEIRIGSTGFLALVNNSYYNDKSTVSVGYFTNTIPNDQYEIQIYIQNAIGLKKQVFHSSQHKITQKYDSCNPKNLVTIESSYKSLFKNVAEVHVGFIIRKIIDDRKTQLVISPCNSLNLSNVNFTGVQLESSYSEKLWKEKLFTDFVFKVNGQEYPVHKSILAAQSDVFRLMFNSEHNMQENITNTAVITDISPEAFEQFLEYLYIRTYPTYNIFTVDLYKAAHKYDIYDLISLCESLIKPKVCENNAMEMLEFANIYEIEDIKNSAFDIIQKKLFPNDNLTSNLKNHPKLVKRLVEAKNLMNKNMQSAMSKYAAELDAVQKEAL